MKIPVVCYLALMAPLFAEDLFDNSSMDTAVLEGTGDVYFDDITVEALKK